MITAATTIAAVAVATASANDCNWNAPGADPYRPGAAAHERAWQAMKRYPDLSLADRLEVTAKVRWLQPDATAVITRDAVASNDGHVTNLRDMQWGKDTLCVGPINRSAWAANDEQPVLIYTTLSGKSVGFATICGNPVRMDFARRETTEPETRAPGTWEPQNMPWQNDADRWGMHRVPQEPDYRPLPQPVQPPTRPREVPEPGTLALVGIALALMWTRR